MKKKFLILILFLSLVGCRSLPSFDLDEGVDYTTFNEYKLDSINNLYSQKEDVYGVYLYQSGCEACQNIKNSILGYLSEYQETNKGFKIYLYNTSRLSGEYPSFNKGSGNLDEDKSVMENLKPNTIEETYFGATPSLYVITQSYLKEYYYGKECAYYLFYDSVYDSRSYDNYLDKEIEIDDFYLINKDIYYVYLYYSSCPHCLRTKKSVLNYLDNYSNLYLINMYPSSTEKGKENRSKFKSCEVSSTEEFSKFIEIMKKEEVNEVSSTYYAFVPSLYIVENNKFSDAKVGEEDINSFLNSF